jgi:hypothetical protein
VIDYYYHPKHGTPEFRFDPDITVVAPLRGLEEVLFAPEPAVMVTLLSGLASLIGFSRLRLFPR